MPNPGIATCLQCGENRRVEYPGHLLVDGYNVLHAWGWGGPRADATARDRLVETVRVLHDAQRIRVTIVFDGRAPVPIADPASAEEDFAVIFAPADRTADTVIEALVTHDPDPRRCTVATADRLERETVAAAGASCLTPEELAAWCDTVRRRLSESAARRAAKGDQDWGTRLPL